MNIKPIYQACLKEIGGRSNGDVNWYLNDRPKIVTRKSFFNVVIFAVWVSGVSRVSARSFLERAGENGFSWDYDDIADQSAQEWNRFMKNLHGYPIPPKAKEKWAAIRSIAKIVADFDSNKEFRKSFFQGKYKSCDLDKSDVMAIRSMKLPYIGPANSQFIIRNMGGEEVKCDRWVNAFMNYYSLPYNELLKELEVEKIPEGMFDLVIWAYCEMHVKDTKKFNKHFRNHFG